MTSDLCTVLVTLIYTMPTFVPFERETKQQIMYNVILRQIRATIFSVVNQLTLHAYSEGVL